MLTPEEKAALETLTMLATTPNHPLANATTLKDVESQIEKEYSNAHTDAVSFFKKFAEQNTKRLTQKIESSIEQHNQLETILRDRIKSLSDVKQTLEVLSQRQSNIETLQQNVEKLEEELQKRRDRLGSSY